MESRLLLSLSHISLSNLFPLSDFSISNVWPPLGLFYSSVRALFRVSIGSVCEIVFPFLFTRSRSFLASISHVIFVSTDATGECREHLLWRLFAIFRFLSCSSRSFLTFLSISLHHCYRTLLYIIGAEQHLFKDYSSLCFFRRSSLPCLSLNVLNVFKCSQFFAFPFFNSSSACVPFCVYALLTLLLLWVTGTSLQRFFIFLVSPLRVFPSFTLLPHTFLHYSITTWGC